MSPPPRPTNASIVAGSMPASPSAAMMVSRRYGSWSLTPSKPASVAASWSTVLSMIARSPSNTPTFVEVDPGLITRIR